MDMTTEEKESLAMCSDIFNRAKIAEKMSDLLCDASIDSISPATLDGLWGSGKTVHACRMEKYINEKKNKTHYCVYWNAAETDFANDPLPILVTHLAHLVPEENLPKFAENGFKLCWSVLPYVGGDILLQLISTSLHIDLKSAAKEAKQTADKDGLIGQFENIISKAREDTLSVDIAKQLIDNVSGDRQLIVIVDELDRCRPDYALKILERIKHLFSTSNCKFLLVVNKISLIAFICKLYGLDENQATLYLNKFIKLDFSLPYYTSINGYKFDTVTKYLEHKLSMEENKSIPYNQNDIKFVSKVFVLNKLQFREVDKFVNLSKIIYSVYRESDWGRNRPWCEFLSLSLAFTSYLIAFRNDIIYEMISKTTTTESVLNNLQMNFKDKNDADDRLLSYMREDLSKVIDEYFTAELANAGHGHFYSSSEDFIVFSSHMLTRWFEYSAFL